MYYFFFFLWRNLVTELPAVWLPGLEDGIKVESHYTHMQYSADWVDKWPVNDKCNQHWQSSFLFVVNLSGIYPLSYLHHLEVINI